MESHDHAIRLKAEIMVDHFHERVIAPAKIGGQARAMVVCSGIERAIQYFHAFKAYLLERRSPYRPKSAPQKIWVSKTNCSLSGIEAKQGQLV